MPVMGGRAWRGDGSPERRWNDKDRSPRVGRRSRGKSPAFGPDWQSEAIAMRELIAVLKAVADENRVRVLWAVRRRELCVCQIVELLGLAQSTVSKHVSILHAARLVESRKEGRWIYYRAAGADAPAVARSVAEVVCKAYARSPEAAKDDKLLERILKIDRDELCRRQSRG